MNPVLKKMNFKEHQSVCLLHAPSSFEEVAEELSGLASEARFIKTMKREKLRAMSEEGKKRIK